MTGQPEKWYRISESQIRDLEFIAEDISTHGGEEDQRCILDHVRSNPIDSAEQVLDELIGENSARIFELQSWVRIYKDEKMKCNALAILGERQYLAVKLKELRQQQEQQGGGKSARGDYP